MPASVGYRYRPTVAILIPVNNVKFIHEGEILKKIKKGKHDMHSGLGQLKEKEANRYRS
jgi:hypothetical protein